jgi:hypothetical protein
MSYSGDVCGASDMSTKLEDLIIQFAVCAAANLFQLVTYSLTNIELAC